LKVTELYYNWFYTNDEFGEEFYKYIVGESGVTKIEEHLPKFEGDKFYYDVYFESGIKHRVFNPNEVVYQ